jgi:hypothetical protein
MKEALAVHIPLACGVGVSSSSLESIDIGLDVAPEWRNEPSPSREWHERVTFQNTLAAQLMLAQQSDNTSNSVMD